MNTFDPATHTYSMDGRPVPSVTQVLKETGFIDTSHYPPGAAERGAAVHEMLALSDCQRLDLSSIGEDLAGYLLAWTRFRLAMHLNWPCMRIETPEYGIAGYAGTPDRVLHERMLVLDIKSGDIEWWVKYQLAGYVALVDGGAYGWHGMAVAVRADGTYTTKCYDGAEIAAAKQVFRSALSVCQCIRAKGG